MKLVVTPEAIERELKIGIQVNHANDLDQFISQLNVDLEGPEDLQIKDTYYDTPCGLLHEKGLAVRIRNVADSYIMTVKIKVDDEIGISSRREWHVGVKNAELDPDYLRQIPVPISLRPVLKNNVLQPLFKNHFDRLEWILKVKETKMSLAFDSGFTVAGSRQSPISELELELINGEIDVLIETGMSVADLIPSYMAFISKAERGHRILQQSNPMEDRRPECRFRLLKWMGRSLDPLSGPNFREASEALIKIGDPEAISQFLGQIRNKTIPLGLARWMITKARYWSPS